MSAAGERAEGRMIAPPNRSFWGMTRPLPGGYAPSGRAPGPVAVPVPRGWSCPTVADRPYVLVATAVSRDPIATALAMSRPEVAVVQVEPDALGTAVARLRPRLVIYDAPDEVVETRVGAWVLLHPGGENVAIVGLAGSRQTVRCPGLADLLAAVDAAAGTPLATGS